ncbi:unnamed protein product [Discosporangium mesarthrocarpum]
MSTGTGALGESQFRVFGDNEAHEVKIPGLFIGSRTASEDLASLQANGVTHILSLNGADPAYPDKFEYKVAGVEEGEKMDEVVESSVQFIQRALEKGGTVLAHCNGGGGRSGVVTIATTMRMRGMGLEEAHTEVRAIRPNVKPDLSFYANQLEGWMP